MDRRVIYDDKEYSLSGIHKEVGEIAEDFIVTDSHLEAFHFYDMPKGVKIISSCTSIDTPMCSLQNKRLNAEIYISTESIVALAISVDLPFAQDKFLFEEDIEHLVMLSDYKTLDFGRKYGVLIESLRMLSRALFVVDANNVIRYAEYVENNKSSFNYIKAVSIAKKLHRGEEKRPKRKRS